jgi:hypothetical protein
LLYRIKLLKLIMRTIGKIIVDLLTSNHLSESEAEMLITKLSENTNKSLSLRPRSTSDSYWVQTTTA